MKSILPLLLLLITFNSNAQSKSVETDSIILDDFISFIAENFSVHTNETTPNEEEVKSKHITFLLETSNRSFSSEDKIILQQAFKFLSKRLNETDRFSIVLYSKVNGLILEESTPKNIKKTLNALNNDSSKFIKNYNDGITSAYQLAESYANETTESSVIMVRNPNASKTVEATAQKDIKSDLTTETKPKNNMVLLTAIAVLPELISIIKD
ncbi:hypothetical protein [Lacinutrix salivirga]